MLIRTGRTENPCWRAARAVDQNAGLGIIPLLWLVPAAGVIGGLTAWASHQENAPWYLDPMGVLFPGELPASTQKPIPAAKGPTVTVGPEGKPVVEAWTPEKAQEASDQAIRDWQRAVMKDLDPAARKLWSPDELPSWVIPAALALGAVALGYLVWNRPQGRRRR